MALALMEGWFTAMNMIIAVDDPDPCDPSGWSPLILVGAQSPELASGAGLHEQVGPALHADAAGKAEGAFGSTGSHIP